LTSKQQDFPLLKILIAYLLLVTEITPDGISFLSPGDLVLAGMGMIDSAAFGKVSRG
jgi:hypothetical protein